MTLLALEETLFHIPMVDFPTELIAPMAARKISANIKPYSTAVAAFVDRNSATILIIVPAPAFRKNQRS